MFSLRIDLIPWERDRKWRRERAGVGLMNELVRWQTGDSLQQGTCVWVWGVCVRVFLCVSTLAIHFLLRDINLKQGHSAFLPQSFPFIGLLLFYHPPITNLHTGPFLVCCFSLSLQILLSLPVKQWLDKKSFSLTNFLSSVPSLSSMDEWRDEQVMDEWPAGRIEQKRQRGIWLQGGL